MEKSLKKTEWLLAGAGALAISVVLQYLCGMMLLWGARLWIQEVLAAQRITDPTIIAQNVHQWYENNSLWATCFYHVLGIAVFGLWYRAVRKNSVAVPLKQVFAPKYTGALLLTGISLQCFVSSALKVIALTAPELLADYTQKMETTGLQKLGILSFFITVIAAPVGEELLCRGVILFCAERAAGRFWMANILQAAAFGMLHRNWVQGIYAFIMGLVLGCFYHRHGSVWSSIALHAVINLSGILLVQPVLGLIPEKLAWFLPLGLLFAAACALGIKMDRWDRKRPEKARVKNIAKG